jgi:hypothetical protein
MLQRRERTGQITVSRVEHGVALSTPGGLAATSGHRYLTAHNFAASGAREAGNPQVGVATSRPRFAYPAFDDRAVRQQCDDEHIQRVTHDTVK